MPSKHSFNPFSTGISLANKPLNVIFPGNSGVYTNFGGYLDSIASGAAAQKNFSTYFTFLPMTALLTTISGIGKGIV